MMEAYFFVTIDRWGKCRLSTAPLNAGYDGTTAGLPQALALLMLTHLRLLHSYFPVTQSGVQSHLLKRDPFYDTSAFKSPMI